MLEEVTTGVPWTGPTVESVLTVGEPLLVVTAVPATAALVEAAALHAGTLESRAADYIPAEVANPSKSWAVIGLGVLASGGSGLWNSVLTYVAKVKDIKKAEADLKMSAAVQAKSPVKP